MAASDPVNICLVGVSTFDPVNICLVGVSNFAESHAAAIVQMEAEGLGRLACAVVRRPAKYAEAVARYRERGVRVYECFGEMLDGERGRTELIALPVAIPDHSEMSVAAMEAGYDVLCEKPPAATIEQIDAMIATSERTGRACCIGFQNQSKNTVRGLKRAICEGKLGVIEHIEVMATWVRLETYYERNAWAGKLIYEGKYCLDGPLTNALAHYLFNALYWASPVWREAAQPARVRAEIHHAHPIESDDCCAVKLETVDGVQVTYLVTLAAWEDIGPLSKVHGTKGWAEWSMSGPAVLHLGDGATEVIEADGQAEHHEVFRNMIRHMRLGEELNCPVAMTRPFQVAMNAAFESNGRPEQIPAEYVTREPREGTIFTAISGITEIVRQGYEEAKTFSELGVLWAKATPWVATREYEAFRPGF